MQFSRLRLTGFKSFVDPTEMRIEPGLTGIVGPNGCGKSNLVEALRWAMGEGSAKSLRGAAMDDVIFAGAASRPARNTAEVSLLLENHDRRAPAAFNDAETIEVSRRIERESGSVYRVNGREARARDVQLLFADSASGAHSPALVGQGRVGALISAKPSERRAILEEAAGISGLHTRRHEAELKLRAADANLARLGDVMGEVEGRLASLRRQARQATRYRTLSVSLRAAESLLLVLRWRAATAALEAAEQARREADAAVETTTREAARAAAEQAESASCLPDLRAAEAEEAARLHRLTLERDRLVAEERHLRERIESDRATMRRTEQDETREQAVVDDAHRALARAEQEQIELQADQAGEAEARAVAEARLAETAALVAERERALDDLNGQLAALTARRQALSRERNEAAQALQRLEPQIRAATAERDSLGPAPAPATPPIEASAEAADQLEAARAAATEAEASRLALQEQEGAVRDALREAETAAARLHAEAKAIEKLIGAGPNDRLWPPMIDAISVPAGLETALATALGDGLSASGDDAAPTHWAVLPPLDDAPPLPEGVAALSGLVAAPPALARALSQIGLVTRADGARLRGALRAGQCLVSREGDLWRWDGFTASAEAPSAAARGLEQRNRLKVLIGLCAKADSRLAESRALFDQARTGLAQATQAETAARQRLRAAETALAQARERQAQAERAEAQRAARLSAITDRLARLDQDATEARARLATVDETIAALPPEDRLREQLAGLRREVEALRAAAAQARGASDSLRREIEARARRREALTREAADWRGRVEGAATHLAALAARKAELADQIAALADAPAQLDTQRIALDATLTEGEVRRKAAADALAAAEIRATEASRVARAADQALAAARETRAARIAAAEAGRTAEREAAAQLAERTGGSPEAALAAADLGDEADQPRPDVVQERIERLRRERDTLGAVNLRAEEEMTEQRAQLDQMEAEKRDLEEAIARLRQAISSLNREGRSRLLAAFAQVSEHFGRLFGTLFEGGEATLALIESDDPLEAGLEITARPPGKKPQILSLLSGGEQALTALALIFAVFLTNPAPICVLDEVDAPLDDANVDRFCRLVQEIAAGGDTRFMVITHHALTMARMDRLYGVTMIEQGVSQLVSVDLGGAQALRAVG